MVGPSIRIRPAGESSKASMVDGGETSHRLIGFLLSQPQSTMNRLYQKPSSCLSIFRLLQPLERQIVMNLLWLETPIPGATMAAWVTREGKRPYQEALSTLQSLHILPQQSTRPGPPQPVKHNLNPTFKASLRQAITGGGTSGSFGILAENDDKHPPPDIEALDAFALERWETILYYMVSSGTGQFPAKPSQGVLYLLQRSGLMATVHGATLQITSAGFQFLLHPPHEQLWELLLQYLQMAEERQMDLVEVLSFLLMLSTTELGKVGVHTIQFIAQVTQAIPHAQSYSTENLSATQKAMLEDLRDYGLIRQRTATSRKFSPTRLATTLTSSSPPLPTSAGTGDGSHVQGFIVLETNYRLYAYTDNPLQIAVLNLFVTLKYRFPNLVVGQITRDSVKKALANGITADQIISYLITHAHPQMRKNKPLLPVTVQDQIRLWELERNRVKSQEGYLYTAFASHADYEWVLDYAKKLGVVLWENPSKRCFFGSVEGHMNIRGYIERRSAGNA
ncbi:transcription factor Tfb2 [Dichomitus squalens LYAD-421 SS1]|uniref:transcription factor Tfb2 n=1 Tax=Dichomitus squalens (strain LYAD-421) TaxID=732165 RepID=UPI000441265F|nr:transcription factor Tfb2 [Dichomitus squalens LYAD-421 SS1]EJF64723.1 transcription factor Tfb2 [Dichomitus squalens LYAD-421 SS1]